MSAKITSARSRRVRVARRARPGVTFMVALVVASVVTVLAGSSAASASDNGQTSGCSGLQNPLGHAANPMAQKLLLTLFVDRGCQPSPAPPSVSVDGGGAYDSYPIGTTTPHTFTVTNVTASSVEVGAVVVGGSGASGFSLTTDQCSGTTLASGASCSLAVSFTPDAARAFAATLAVSTTGSGLVYSQLSGDGPVAPVSFSMTTSPPNPWDYHYDFLPPTEIGDAPAWGVINYTYTPNYSNVDVTPVDADGLPYHGPATATLTSDDCPYQVQGDPTYTFTAADDGAHRFLMSLGDRPTFTAVCTLRVHDSSGLLADGTAPGHVVGELCNGADDNGNGAADELFPQVPVLATAPDGSHNDNPHPAQSVSVVVNGQLRTGAWSCSADKTHAVPLDGGIVL